MVKPSLIAFDVDGVLLEPKSSWSTVHSYFGVKNKESLEAFLRGEIDYQEFVDRDINLWLSKRNRITRIDFDKISQNVLPNPNHRYLSDFLNEFAGTKIAISGGVDVIISKASKYFKLDEVYSNVLVFDDDVLVGGRAVVNPYDKGKFLRKHDGKKISVGDSRWDLDMFKNSEYSILFNSEEEIDGVDCIIHGNDLKELATVLKDLI